MTVDSLQTALGYEFLRTPALHLEDGGQNQISKQRGFQFVNPSDDWFPGEKYFSAILCAAVILFFEIKNLEIVCSSAISFSL